MSAWPSMVRRYGDTDFVTALRAIAATMVVVTHAGAPSELGTIGQNIVSSGKYGVQIFFVISGFSIATTLATMAGYREFFVRRLFRIGPLYWLLTLVVAAATMNGLLPQNYWSNYFGTEIDAYNVLMHLSFSSFFDHTIGTTILGVEWTIPVEVFWYAFLPMIIAFAKTPRRLQQAFAVSVLAVVLTQLASKFIIAENSSLFAKWFPTSHGPYFIAGVMAYRLRQTADTWLHAHAQRVLLAAWSVLGLCVCVGASGQGLIFGAVTCLTIGLFQPNQMNAVNRIMSAKPLLFVGSISYSLYLVHIPVILLLNEAGLNRGWAFLSTTFVVSLVVSTLLYAFVEYPMNQLGKKFGQSRKKLSPTTTQSVESSEVVDRPKAA